jgi:hypothetical protein
VARDPWRKRKSLAVIYFRSEREPRPLKEKTRNLTQKTLRAWRKRRVKKRVPFAEAALGEPEWELLVYTRQFSYEWEVKELQDTELGRVRKAKKTGDLQMHFLREKGRWEQKEFK